MFDVVLFAGVLYHLKHPLLVLEQMSRICNETLIVETHLNALNLSRPAMVFYPGKELASDPANWWDLNPACVTAMLRTAG
jgi:tRNA (mo5U34)-methyltransferase